MSVYLKDNPESLEIALSSIWIRQSLRPSQIVLVEDGTLSRELYCVIRSWQKKLGSLFEVISFSTNKGLGSALNVALQKCTFDLVARMDADDISLPERFQKQVSFFSSNPSVDILGTAVQEIEVFGRLIGERYVPVTHETIISNLWTCPMIHPTVMFRRFRILKAGNYSTDLRRRQDYELWFRCAEHGLRFHNLPEMLLQYRFGEHTHKKQSIKISWQQGMIGFEGSGKIGIPMRHRLLCFVPFLRSLLPQQFQHFAYKALSRWDPRKKVEK